MCVCVFPGSPGSWGHIPAKTLSFCVELSPGGSFRGASERLCWGSWCTPGIPDQASPEPILLLHWVHNSRSSTLLPGSIACHTSPVRLRNALYEFLIHAIGWIPGASCKFSSFCLPLYANRCSLQITLHRADPPLRPKSLNITLETSPPFAGNPPTSRHFRAPSPRPTLSHIQDILSSAVYVSFTALHVNQRLLCRSHFSVRHSPQSPSWLFLSTHQSVCR